MVLIEKLFANFCSLNRRRGGGEGGKSNVRQGINIGKICCYCGTRTQAGRKGEREEEIGAEMVARRRLSQGREQTHYLL